MIPKEAVVLLARHSKHRSLCVYRELGYADGKLGSPILAPPLLEHTAAYVAY